ncbi:MAG: serine/threonine protein phosphatase [Pseudanabaena sp.]|nr:MAG: serine/threonine protein phosphatase [Pseudanabaena sp.]
MKKLPSFRFKSITHRLIFGCVASAFAIYGVSYWHGRYIIQNVVGSWLISMTSSQIDNAANEIDGKLLRIERDIWKLDRSIQILEGNSDVYARELLSRLPNLLERQPLIRSIALLSVNNGGWQYDRQNKYKNLSGDESGVWLSRCQGDRLSSSNSSVRQNLPSQAFWTEAYFLVNPSNAKQARIAYCLPLSKMSASTVSASSAIAVEVDLDWLPDFMKRQFSGYDEINYAELGDLFVAIPNNKLDKPWLLQPNNPQLLNFWLSQQKRDWEDIPSKREQVKVQHNPQVSAISQIVTTTGWYVGIGFPSDKLDQASQKYLWMMVLSMSKDMALMCVVIAFISQRTTSSLRELNKSTQEMAKGNLDTNLPPVTSDDEVGRLTQSFRGMRDSLQIYIHDLQETTAAKQKLESELSIAAQIQRAMLPSTRLNADSPYDISAMLEPARIVGGDLYDFFLLGNDRLCLIIGDVADKGFPSALQMARTIALIRTITKVYSTPSEILSTVNLELCRENEDCQFVTVFCGVLNLLSGKFTYASGGHDSPILVRGRQVQYLNLETMPPLGLYEDSVFEQQEFTLVGNDLVLFYTDGITEAMNVDGECFSDTRLLEAIASYPPTSATRAVRTVQHFCQQFVGDAPQSDDITLLAMQYLPLSPFSQVTNVMEWNLTLNSELTELENVKLNIDRILHEINLPVEQIENTQLIVEEVLVNIIQYGYGDRRDGFIDIRIEMSNQNLTTIFVDGGKPFNPLTEITMPNLDRTDDERSLGGFGFFLVQELADGVDYDYRDGKNILTVSQVIKL